MIILDIIIYITIIARGLVIGIILEINFLNLKN